MTPQDFIAAISKAAQASEVSSKIPASFTIAQAALESGWGANVPGNNLFGIKADASWSGGVVSINTHEFINGIRVLRQDRFRSYPDWLSSINDHAKFLTSNPRYKPAFACSTVHSFTCEIASSGYASDPNYAAMINSIIDTHNLTRFDA